MYANFTLPMPIHTAVPLIWRFLHFCTLIKNLRLDDDDDDDDDVIITCLSLIFLGFQFIIHC